MSYLWSQKDLWRRVEHDSEDVQDWAVERLLDMYPESEAELLLKIPDLPSKTVNRLLSRGTGEVCPAGLLDIYAQVDNPQHKAGIAALLIRHGHDVPVAPGDELRWELLPSVVTSGRSPRAIGVALDFDSLAEELVHLGLGQAGSEAADVHSRIVDRVEREVIAQVLHEQGGVQIKAASRLGINRNTLHKKLKQYGLENNSGVVE